jgi:GTPase-activating protein SST2
MVSLPLTPHRVRFSRVEHTFTTEEAITNLGSLKFSQSNRMPDPKDPSRIVTTTTTTTFSMAKEMARSVCMRFLEARFVESVDNKTDFSSKSSVWQLTPKGMHVLGRFCQRNGIHQRHVNEVLDSPRNMMSLVILERAPDTDKLVDDAPTIHVVFRRFAGDTGPNVRHQSSRSDSDSMDDYATGLIGVKMQRSSRRNEKEVPYIFTGKAAFDWLMDCSTVVDKREVFEMANHFMQHELIVPVGDERGQQTNGNRFAASKHVLYGITQKGMRIAGWVTSPNGSVNGDATAQRGLPQGVVRDSNTNRMTVIIRDPALRLLFREYLRETHCEENLSFYVEVKAFLAEYERAKRDTASPRLDVIRETLASAYSLYNAFLAPGSPCELNIDHNLRNALAGRMTRAVGEDEQMLRSLDEVAVLFDQAQSSVFKLMASVSCLDYPGYLTMTMLTLTTGFGAQVLTGAKICCHPSRTQPGEHAHEFCRCNDLIRHCTVRTILQ